MSSITSRQSLVSSVDAEELGSSLAALDLVLVEFWAPWCQLSKLTYPKVRQLARRFYGRVRIARCCITEANGRLLTTSQKVEHVPELRLYCKGNPVMSWLGDTDIEVIETEINVALYNLHVASLMGDTECTCVYQRSMPVAVISGAGRGLGRAMAERLGQEGYFVVINYRTDSASALETYARVRRTGADGLIYKADISNPNQVRQMFSDIFHCHGRVDLVVNNAGITRDQHFLLLKTEAWDEVMRTNLSAVRTCCQQAARIMSDQGWGTIVNIGSSASLSARPSQVSYSSSKSALIGLTRSLARELQDKSINVSAVIPGLTRSDMAAAIGKDLLAKSIAKIPLRRWAEPDEIAAAVAFCASPSGRCMNGKSIVVDGGRTAAEGEIKS
ncbi:MAG: SDR family oxidoreductase [Pseudomonadota bacterium]|nr:SDR family oxidoreductase [Pseudomonadota bacterium]